VTVKKKFRSLRSQTYPLLSHLEDDVSPLNVVHITHGTSPYPVSNSMLLELKRGGRKWVEKR